MKKRIVRASEELFFVFGYSKTTSDEIAKKAGVSKRTLYKYFESKKQILNQVVDDKLLHLREELQDILKLTVDFPEKMRRITTCVALTLSGLSRHFLDDLRTNIPPVWEKISGFRREMVQVYFPMLLDEGVREGHFKKSINKGVAVLLMLNAMEIIINPEINRNLPGELAQEIPARPEDLFDKVIEIIYEGIHQGESLFKS